MALFLEFLPQIVEICLLPLLTILTTYLVKLINQKISDLAEKAKSAKEAKYIRMVGETITSCVLMTNQTYVETLKKQDDFGPESQKVALEMTLAAVLALLTTEVKTYIAEAYGDLNAYLLTQIEATVNEVKE